MHVWVLCVISGHIRAQKTSARPTRRAFGFCVLLYCSLADNFDTAAVEEGEIHEIDRRILIEVNSAAPVRPPCAYCIYTAENNIADFHASANGTLGPPEFNTAVDLLA
jgi:hypothetical protein